MKLFSFLVRNYPGSVALAVLASVATGVCNTLLLAVINTALTGGGSYPWGTLFAAFVALCLLLPLSRFATEYILTRVGTGTAYDLRLRLSRKILAAPLRGLEEFGGHRLMTSLTEDLPAISGTMQVISNLCVNVAVVVGGLVYLGWLSPAALAAGLGLLAVGGLLYQLPVIKAMRLLRLARLENDRLFSHFRALTTGTKELKLHRRRREMFFSRVLEPTAALLRRYVVLSTMIYAAAASWGQSMLYVVVGAVVFLLSSLHGGESRVTTGYTMTLLYLMAPLQVIMGALPTLARGSVALARVEGIGLSLTADGAEGASPEAEDAASFSLLELDGVTHSYRRENGPDSFVLGPVDFELRPAELVFLVGGNGGGKTTLAKLLTGLYTPEGGEVRLDGRRVEDEEREYLRSLFSVVFSDFYLFDSLLGLERPKLDAHAHEHLVRLQLDSKVSVRDGVLSTTDLSQGQRKRLALLAAYLEDRPAYVFDEWAADQDPSFKDFFYTQLLPELKERGKAVVVITHDDRYYHLADRILKLEDGRLAGLPRSPLHFAPAS
ncbi:MAG: cyclic peptide export ABC transporter [Pyrinomonadaceae bacterium]